MMDHLPLQSPKLEHEKIWRYFSESVVHHGFIVMEPNLVSRLRPDLWAKPEHCDGFLYEYTFREDRFAPLRDQFFAWGLKPFKVRREESGVWIPVAARSERQLDAYYEKHRGEIEGARDANRAAREMAKLRSENREIMASKDYSESEKANLIGENNRLIKQLSREFMKENARP